MLDNSGELRAKAFKVGSLKIKALNVPQGHIKSQMNSSG